MATKKTALVDTDTGDIIDFGDKPFVRRPWHRSRHGFECEGESKTQQYHKDLTDINNIVNRYQRTGELPPAKIQGQYGDVTSLQGDLGERIIASKEAIAEADKHLAKKNKEREDAKKASSQTEEPKPTTGESAPTQPGPAPTKAPSSSS